MIRPTSVEDVPRLKSIVAATELFPPELLDGMLDGYLNRDDCRDVWLTMEDDQGPIGLAYVAPEPMTDGTWNFISLKPWCNN